MENTFALKGTILHTPTPAAFEVTEGYAVCRDGQVEGLYDALPPAFSRMTVYDYTGRLIIPGMADIHQHAPQYGFRGLGMAMDPDSVWSSWFEQYSLPEERHYADLAYADAAYERFADDLLHTATTRTCTFATIHRGATELLMEKLARRGFVSYVGKLNMDRSSIEGLQETTEETLRETRLWLEDTCGKYELVKPMITPRYVPSCTRSCMAGLRELIREFRVPVQSHLDEGLDEIAWVRQLEPEAASYAALYDEYEMLGGTVPSVQAHCVFPTEEEFELMRRRPNLWVAHCPQSNLHITGYAAPVRRYLEAGIHVGLGSDMAAGSTLNLFRAVTDAVIASRIYWHTAERKGDPFAEKTYLSLAEAFYLATKGGGALWGRAGSFEPGYCFDAVVIDDRPLADLNPRTPRQRIERAAYLSDERHLEAKFINGRKVL